MNFEFLPQPIPDVVLIKPNIIFDERGYFLELYKKRIFKAGGIVEDFNQDNLSFSKKGVIRGLHFQAKPHNQGKLVYVMKGKIFDVAVDMRKSSPTFKKYLGVYLDANERNGLYIPPGFAHGFCAMDDENIVIYKNTKEYSRKHDAGIIYNDPDIDIVWPVDNPIISEKDLLLPTLKEYLK